jgi:hypothetical protein
MGFREFDQSTDISSQLSAINEVISITGSLFSNTDYYTKYYLNITSGSVVSGGFFATVFDGAPTSVSSSALMDLTWGISSASLLNGYSESFLLNEKGRIYKQMAKLLLGNEDSLFQFGGATYHELVFLLAKRRIFKDEIQKGNTTLVMQMTGTDSVNTLSLTDAGAASTFSVGPSGDEADLFSGSAKIGKVYYNVGIVAYASGAHVPAGVADSPAWSGSLSLDQVAVSGNLDHFVYGLKNRISAIQFHNQTNLHSTIYFCRALNSDFNYSTNPTFIDGDGRIIPTSGSDNQTRTYITTVGLYDINNNLLAVAKTSEPVKKSPDNELIFRIRLSY